MEPCKENQGQEAHKQGSGTELLPPGLLSRMIGEGLRGSLQGVIEVVAWFTPGECATVATGKGWHITLDVLRYGGIGEEGWRQRPWAPEGWKAIALGEGQRVLTSPHMYYHTELRDAGGRPKKREVLALPQGSFEEGHYLRCRGSGSGEEAGLVLRSAKGVCQALGLSLVCSWEGARPSPARETPINRT